MVIKVADFGLTVIKRSRGGGNGNDGGVVSPAISNSQAAGPMVGSSGATGGGIDGVMGTPQFMAPEVLEGQTYGGQVDVYAFGIVMCEILSRVLPFSDRYRRFDFIDAVLEEGAIPTVPIWIRAPNCNVGTAAFPSLSGAMDEWHSFWEREWWTAVDEMSRQQNARRQSLSSSSIASASSERMRAARDRSSSTQGIPADAIGIRPDIADTLLLESDANPHPVSSLLSSAESKASTELSPGTAMSSSRMARLSRVQALMKPNLL